MFATFHARVDQETAKIIQGNSKMTMIFLALTVKKWIDAVYLWHSAIIMMIGAMVWARRWRWFSHGSLTLTIKIN